MKWIFRHIKHNFAQTNTWKYGFIKTLRNFFYFLPRNKTEYKNIISNYNKWNVYRNTNLTQQLLREYSFIKNRRQKAKYSVLFGLRTSRKMRTKNCFSKIIRQFLKKNLLGGRTKLLAIFVFWFVWKGNIFAEFCRSPFTHKKLLLMNVTTWDSWACQTYVFAQHVDSNIKRNFAGISFLINCLVSRNLIDRICFLKFGIFGWLRNLPDPRRIISRLWLKGSLEWSVEHF